MRKMAAILVTLLLVGGTCLGQSVAEILKEAKVIELLNYSREDVQKYFATYALETDEEDYQRFSRPQMDVVVYYSSGACDEDADEDDESVIWNVPKERATKIKISFDDPISMANIDIDLSSFMREQTYASNDSNFTYHDKDRGIEFEISDDELSEIILFPPRRLAKKLCSQSTLGRQFYSRQSWFTKELKDRRGCELANLPANVNDLELDKVEVSGPTNMVVSVRTSASDPENDVLTYTYAVTGGQIKGTGSNVVWDLAGVAAGTYTITVGVNDGAGIVGRTVSKVVKIK